MIPNSFIKLKEDLIKIKDLGFVPCTRSNNKDGGIGNTLEDLLKIKENNLQDKDYLDYEIKSQREATSSAITLFSMATSNGKNRILFNDYSRISEVDNVSRLYWTIHMNKNSLLYGRYNCKLEFDVPEKPEFLYLKIIDTLNNNEDKRAYWNIEKLKNKIDNKMKNLVICYADTKVINNKRHFHYNKFECYFDFDFNKLLEYIEKGHVQVDFRIGADLEGKKAGKYHDHGTGFRIHGKNMLKLYSHVEIF